MTSSDSTSAPAMSSPIVLPPTVRQSSARCGAQARQQRRHAARIVEVLHQELAGGPQVRDHRHLSRDPIEVLDRQRDAGPAGHRDEVDDRVGRPAQRHVGDDAVAERVGREDGRRAEVLPHHLHGTSPRGRRHPRMRRMHGRNRRRARQRQPQRLGDRRHRRRGPHRHARARRSRDAFLDLAQRAFVEVAGLAFGPVLPDVGAAAEALGAEAAGQHRAGGHEDRGQVHRDRAHDQPGHGLVAPAHQHHAVDRVRSQDLLDLERQQVAVEHRRRLDEHLRQRQHRHLDREPAGLPHALLDVLRALAEVPVALLQVAPGVEDRDDRLALGIVGRVPQLPEPAAMTEAAQVVGSEPPLRPQVGGRAPGGAPRGTRWGWDTWVGHGRRWKKPSRKSTLTAS